jgi:hypothetical protein
MDDGTPPTTWLQDTAMSNAIISPRRSSRALVQNFVPGDTDLFVVEYDLKGKLLTSGLKFEQARNLLYSQSYSLLVLLKLGDSRDTRTEALV